MALIGEMQYLTIGENTYSLPSGGGGSVTSVAVSNATNGGLSVSGSPISSSGTITIGHSNVLSSAQTTQAVYPIKIDKNGHISGYGSAVTITDTKNTAGSTDSNSKLFLIGATSQAANPQTYSHDTAYVGTDGYLYSNSKKTLVEQYSNNGYNLKITPSVSNSYADFRIQAALDDTGNFYETLYFGSDGFSISNDIDEKSWININENSDPPVNITGVRTPTEQYDAANKKYVDDSINALNGSITGTAGAGKTLTAFSQTNGKVTATFGNISITKSQISDFPTIPTVNNATLTIQKNGTTVNSFTANASSNVTANISVPTKVSELTNDSGYITNAGVTSITTSAGAHSIKSSATGAVSFNVPTTAAHVGAATSDHTHGNITNGGDITTTAEIANGDRLIINDESASKVTNSSITFGTSSTKYLSNAGTWVDLPTAKEDFEFTFTVTYNSGGYWNNSATCTKTYSEVVTAYNAGKNLKAKLNLYRTNGSNEYDTIPLECTLRYPDNLDPDFEFVGWYSDYQLICSFEILEADMISPYFLYEEYPSKFFVSQNYKPKQTAVNTATADTGTTTTLVSSVTQNTNGVITVKTKSIPKTTNSNTTGISIPDHSTSSITGVQSSTTTASKVTLGTAISVTGVSGSTTASKVTVGSHSTDYGVKAAGSGSFTSGAFSGGSGSFSATVTGHVLSFSHTHTAATHGADSHSHTAPTLGSKIPTVSASDVTVPKAATSATSIPNVTAATDVTVPIKNSSSTTVVTGKSHTVTDNGHTHTLS